MFEEMYLFDFIILLTFNDENTVWLRMFLFDKSETYTYT